MSSLMERRAVRWPVLFSLGIGVALVAAWVIHPNYLDWCLALQGVPCSPITMGRLTGYSVVLVGVVVLILGPVANSLYHLFRYGQQWETPRGPETAISNLPIALGFVYMILGVAIAASA